MSQGPIGVASTATMAIAPASIEYGIDSVLAQDYPRLEYIVIDDVTNVIQEGHSSTTAMHGSTEEEQFH